jgi:hypothetical protein
MIKLLDLIREAKQVGTIYHHTTYYNASNILDSGKLCSSREPYDDGMYAISFTRSSKLHGNFLSHEGGSQVRFILDGDRLSQKYKVRPFSDTGYGGREAEEQIVKKEWFCIPILDYITGIEHLEEPENSFDQKHYDKLITLCKESNIKIK